jgi:transcriptional regulator GlxA family with amidase domain
VQITPLLRELIVTSLAGRTLCPGSRDERIYELILDEIRGMAVLPFGLPEPERGAAPFVSQVREMPGKLEQPAGGEESSMSERTLNRHFQQQTTLTWS